MQVIESNYKFKIFIIFTIGLLVITLITSIATYSIYQNIMSNHQNKADKIIEIYEKNYSSILSDLEYFKMIDFNTSDTKVLEKFKKFATLMYSENQFVNGIGLVKQFDKNNQQQELESLAKITKKDKLTLKPIGDILKSNVKVAEDDLLSVLISRIPNHSKLDVIGLELSSEGKRKRIIDLMNLTGNSYLTDPIKILDDKKEFTYSSVLYFPLYKEGSADYFKWYIVVPMIGQKILNSFSKEHIYFNKYHIHIFDKLSDSSNKEVCICDNDKLCDLDPKNLHGHGFTHAHLGSHTHDHVVLIKEHIINIGNRDMRVMITVDEIFTFEKFWTVILGFISGIFFLFLIVNYLFYKERKEQEIKKISNLDHLTQTFNRVYFDEQFSIKVDEYKRYQHEFSIIIFDIDYFKQINDTHGHAEGDQVLINFSKLINLHIRSVDIFARWGGEEFIILLPNIDKDNAVKVAEKLREAVENYNFSKTYSITCSFGVAQVEADDSESSLFQRADKALYEAKEGGRNQVVVN